MRFNLWEKIEEIRQKPEEARMRYVFFSLFVSMLFVFGIWMLSLEESVQNVKNAISKPSYDKLPSLPTEEKESLNTLLQKAIPINTDSPTDQSNYFQQAVEKEKQNAETKQQ